jgi:glycosyltransferase involved in cell wall biosynthesis
MNTGPSQQQGPVPMRICLDLRFKTESGASSYIRQLVPALIRADPTVEYVAVRYPWQQFDFEPALTEVIVAPGGPDWFDLLWTIAVLPRSMKAKRIDLYHALKMPGPYWAGVKTVRTVHSIANAYRGEYPRTLKQNAYHLYANPTVRKSDRIVAVSNYVRDFVLDRFLVPPDRVQVIYHGIDAAFRPLEREACQPVLQRLGISREFVLCLGNVFPVKNHVTAVHAFAAIADRFPDLDLVIAGGTHDPYFQAVQKAIGDHGLQRRVRLPGFVEAADLPYLLNGALLLFLPSLTEGLPISMLEGIACGLPVVASRRGGLEEIGQNCAALVDDPMDHEAFGAVLGDLCGSERARESLRRKALLRAEDFRWARAAVDHLRAYRVAAGLE